MPYIYHTNQPNVGKYTSPMDGMGNYSQMPFPKQCCGAYSEQDYSWAAYSITFTLSIVISYLPSYRVSGSRREKTLPQLTLTLPNIAPENRPSQKEISSSNHSFSGTT